MNELLAWLITPAISPLGFFLGMAFLYFTNGFREGLIERYRERYRQTHG